MGGAPVRAASGTGEYALVDGWSSAAKVDDGAEFFDVGQAPVVVTISCVGVAVGSPSEGLWPIAKGGRTFANDAILIAVATVVGLAIGAFAPHQAGLSIADGAIAVIGVAIIGVVAEMRFDGSAGADQADKVVPVLTSTLSQLNILILFAINLKLHTTAFCFYRALLLFLFVFYCSSKFIRFCLNFAQHFCAASSCVPTSRPQRYKSPVVPA